MDIEDLTECMDILIGPPMNTEKFNEAIQFLKMICKPLFLTDDKSQYCTQVAHFVNLVNLNDREIYQHANKDITVDIKNIFQKDDKDILKINFNTFINAMDFLAHNVAANDDTEYVKVRYYLTLKELLLGVCQPNPATHQFRLKLIDFIDSLVSILTTMATKDNMKIITRRKNLAKFILIDLGQSHALGSRIISLIVRRVNNVSSYFKKNPNLDITANYLEIWSNLLDILNELLKFAVRHQVQLERDLILECSDSLEFLRKYGRLSDILNYSLDGIIIIYLKENVLTAN